MCRVVAASARCVLGAWQEEDNDGVRGDDELVRGRGPTCRVRLLLRCDDEDRDVGSSAAVVAAGDGGVTAADDVLLRLEMRRLDEDFVGRRTLGVSSDVLVAVGDDDDDGTDDDDDKIWMSCCCSSTAICSMSIPCFCMACPALNIYNKESGARACKMP